ncbi:MAG: glycosyltransferase family 4 protein [Bacteroidetes bacterium]|nr:glycosyltransferase family 4 protein [Bacteroidota bacterium]
MNRKKIMILGKLPPPYMGPSIATDILLKSDLKNRFELIHVDTKINDAISSFGKWNFAKFKRNISVYVVMLNLLIKRKPDLVLVPISQTSTGFIKDSAFIFLAFLFRKKVIIQLRGSDINNWLSRSSGFMRYYFKRTISTTKGVIVLGNNLKYLFKDYFKDDAVFVIPNGGNYYIPKKQKDPADAIKILYFSNLLASKGVEDVFNAINIIHQQKPSHPFSVNFVGAWYAEDVKERCLKLMEDNHLPISIFSPKSGEEKFKFLSEADIFVFPPREPEGHPWAIVEAMAAALPIISTDRGAIIESVIDTKNGFIVEAGKPEKIAEKLKLLLENSELREQMGQESRRLYLDNFTEEKMVDKYTVVFNTVINHEH